MSGDDSLLVPDGEVLEAFGLAREPVRRATSGLINPTWFVRSAGGEPLVLQRVNPIFSPAVNEDIAAVTEHLAAKGVLTPRLVAARSGALWVEHGGAVWRVLTFIDGENRDAVGSPAQARAAGAVLAEFHRAVGDLKHTFRNARLGVHDTVRHLQALRTALDEHREHREMSAVQPLAMRVLALAARLPPLTVAPDRIVHGDPKISNVMFAHGGERALCLIDLDTLARMPVALELGDAVRSWCNPAPEDAANARFDAALFDAAVSGYASAAGGFLTRGEWSAIPAATLTISVELAARFCTDALRERYFRWNPARYASASAHNQARTRGQLQVADRIAAQRDALDEITARAFEK
ncbi:MAG TPA: phosphotransferase [Gammaproteobacteria bacterium]|nr:phosphotransferase [Gammaproteobacteria bacterium]